MPQTRRVALNGPATSAESFRASFPTIEHYLTSEERDADMWPPLSYLQEHVLPPVVSGIDLLKSELVLSTGCPGIDAVLGGGLRGGHLVELAGASGCGKTQICHIATATLARNASGGRVIYIDTSNSFSPSRLTQIAGQGNHATVLSNVTVFRPHDVFQVLGIVDHLGVEMSQISESHLRPVLIILDSISSVVSPVLGGGGHHKHGHTLMVGLGRALKALALGYGIAVLCTNHEVGSSEESRPALGEQWTNQVTVRVRLTKANNNVICATLIRASDLPMGVQHTFTLPGSLD